MQAIYAPVVRDTAISFELEPPTVEDIQQRMVETLAHMPWLVCERRGDILGYVYASQHRSRPAYQWSVDVSVYVHAHARRSGVGRALYRSLFRCLPSKGSIMLTPASRCRTRGVSGCTSPSDFTLWGSTALWATNWAPGTMSGGGNSRCKSA